MITKNPVHRKKAKLIPLNGILREKLIPVLTLLIKEFPTLHATQWFTVVFTGAGHWPLFRA
jgi:hypothetical protein